MRQGGEKREFKKPPKPQKSKTRGKKTKKQKMEDKTEINGFSYKGRKKKTKKEGMAVGC